MSACHPLGTGSGTSTVRMPRYPCGMRKRMIDPREHTVYASLKDFLTADDHPAGVLTVMHGGIPIDLRFDPRGHDVTTVFFHAAVTGGNYRFPLFTGAALSQDLPTNRVFFMDPSLYLADDLFLGWHAGNRKQPRLQWAIRGILNRLIPETQRTVTFGSSGGGFAALYYAASRQRAVAVPVNPQTNIARYIPSLVARYGQRAWGLEGPDALNQMTAITDLTRLYQASSTRVFYVQNKNDASHMEGHFLPFMGALPEPHQVFPVLVDGKAGHHPPDKAITKSVLSAAVDGEESPPLISSVLEVAKS